MGKKTIAESVADPDTICLLRDSGVDYAQGYHIGPPKPVAEFLPDLKGVIFLNPQTNQWETDDQYLSGNVREKLVVADAAAVTDPRFAENVEALKSVQPADLAATEIDVRLGAAWLPPEDVEKFTNELLNVPAGVQIGHIHALGTWSINANWDARGATANTTDWGTDRYTALELIEDALNLKTPTVYDTVDKKPVVNAQSTEAAREKQERIKERFKEWVWSDDSRRERLCRLYNDTFNHTRVRTFNGDHLTLPGASGAIQLHSHQKAGVWRILQTPNTLLAHVVGAGKTYTMVAAAMESRRLGLSGKPMFVVPNHMLGQFSTELLTLYPGANILAAGKEDFESQNRKKLFSRIATGNWDAVIVTHSGFERIPLSRETQERFFKEQLHELEMIRREHADSSNRRLVKELEKAKKRLEAKLQTLAAEHKKDNTLTFEELGVDRGEADLPGRGGEPGPPGCGGGDVSGRHRPPGPEALQIRALVGLQLEQFQKPGPLGGGGHHVQHTVRVGQQQPRCGDAQQPRGTVGQRVQEVDHVEVRDERVGQLHEHVREPGLGLSHRSHPFGMSAIVLSAGPIGGIDARIWDAGLGARQRGPRADRGCPHPGRTAPAPEAAGVGAGGWWKPGGSPADIFSR